MTIISNHSEEQESESAIDHLSLTIEGLWPLNDEWRIALVMDAMTMRRTCRLLIDLRSPRRH